MKIHIELDTSCDVHDLELATALLQILQASTSAISSKLVNNCSHSQEEKTCEADDKVQPQPAIDNSKNKLDDDETDVNQEQVLINTFDQDIAEKDAQIKTLKKNVSDLTTRLERYESPMPDGEQTLFTIMSEHRLKVSWDDNAPFIGKYDAEGKAYFRFNEDKCSHKDFLSKYEGYKGSIFEVVEKEDSPNHITTIDWGSGRFEDGCLKVDTPTKIKLTRE